MEKAYIYKTQVGRFLIVEEDGAVTKVELHVEEERSKEEILSHYQEEETTLMKDASIQLAQYLEGSRKTFDININPKGTQFQKKVWEALRAIPYGETRTYKEIAIEVGNPKASRAVGMANNKNPIICIIPCHRVIGSNGKLVGFACGLDVKERLLGIESNKG